MSIRHPFASLIATVSCLLLVPPNGAVPPTYSSLVPGKALSGVSVGLSSPAAGVRGVTYTVQFTASATGALAQNEGTITVAAAAGTVLPTCAVVKDITSEDSYSRCSQGEPGASVTLSTPIDVGAGHVVQVVFDGVTNTAVVGTHTLTVSTSSDAAATVSYATVPGAPLTGDVVSRSGQPIPGAAVEACPTNGTQCFLGQTDKSGHFSITVEIGHDYRVDARAVTSAGEDLGSGSVAVSVLTSAGATGVVISIDLLTIPAGMTVSGHTSGVPRLNIDDSLSVTTEGCPYGLAAAALQSKEQPSSDETYILLTESPVGSGHYAGVFPPNVIPHGEVRIRAGVYCFRALLPTTGPSTGGTTVLINGKNFTGATRVLFGKTPASAFTVLSDTRIRAVAPPGSGDVSVAVVTPHGSTPITDNGQYSYYSLQSVSPSSAPQIGGSKVTLRGLGLSHIGVLLFGGRVAQSWTVVSDSEIEAVTPPGSGTAKVTALAFGEQLSDLQLGALPFSFESVTGKSRMAAVVPTTAIATLSSPRLAVPLAASSALGRAHAMHQSGDLGIDPISLDPLSPELQDFKNTANDAKDTIEWLAALFGVGYGIAGIVMGSSSLLLVAALGFAWGVAIACVALWIAATWAPHFMKADAYEDPSGTVVDTRGNPIGGARVSIWRAPTSLGPFARVSASDPVIRPSVNPEITDSSGTFQWDVMAGYYRLTAEAPACTAANSIEPVVSTQTLPVPPPQVGIKLVLSCPNEAPPPVPAVTSVDPPLGSANGGTTIVIKGTGFTPSSIVHMSGGAATSVKFLSPQVISAVTPPGTGIADVQVSTDGGRSAQTSGDQYSYQAVPSISKVTPDIGSVAGGQRVHILGTGFGSVSGMKFGSLATSVWTAISDNEIVVDAPGGLPGAVDIVLESLWGKSAVSPLARFTYVTSEKVYVVRSPEGTHNESLWEIAQQHLGDGRRYREIFEMNVGRIQPDGGKLMTPSVIRPGWILNMPLDAYGAEVRIVK